MPSVPKVPSSNIPKVPNIPNVPKIPNIPAMPNIPSIPKIPELTISNDDKGGENNDRLNELANIKLGKAEEIGEEEKK